MYPLLCVPTYASFSLLPSRLPFHSSIESWICPTDPFASSVFCKSPLISGTDLHSHLDLLLAAVDLWPDVPCTHMPLTRAYRRQYVPAFVPGLQPWLVRNTLLFFLAVCRFELVYSLSSCNHAYRRE